MSFVPGSPPRASDLRESGRVPPHSLEAEQAVLGALLIDNQAWETIAGYLTPDDFHVSQNRILYEAIVRLLEENRPCDHLTLGEELRATGRLEEAGGADYLLALSREVPTSANVRAYAEIVRDRSILRQLQQVGTRIVASVFEPQGRKASELLDEAERSVFALAERREAGDTPPLARTYVKEVIEQIGRLHEKASAITGVPTGLRDLDRLTAGLQPGDLIVVAGRPSSGKTSFAMNIAENAAIREHIPTLIFSMEMPAAQLVRRMLSSLGRIDQSRIRTGQLEDDDWPRLTSAVEMISEAPIYIDDSGALSPTDIRGRARRLARQVRIGLIIIDYIQLMQVPGTSENRATEISEISRSIKALAKELAVPVIAISQLNRNVELRPSKRPVMSDLRDSGSIEQDADLIAFIYRDEIYNPETSERGTADVIVAKHRNGSIADLHLAFLASCTRFENLAHDNEAPTDPRWLRTPSSTP
jgi:replicative DNA helicase